MIKTLLLLPGFLCYSMLAFAQAYNNKMLFVIDSIPVLANPESWNQVTQNDIADITLITDKDPLKFLGWAQVDGISYIFTKAYRNRPDSIKSIPGLKQMVSKNGLWYCNDTLYSGRYIDYYYNGNMQAEGTLLNGILNGNVIVYFPNGVIKSVSGYKNGIRHGDWKDYYRNGQLMLTRHYAEGRQDTTGNMYFFNGQPARDVKRSNETAYDTALFYYSTGKVKEMALNTHSHAYRSRQNDDLAYYNTMFYNSLTQGDLKKANKHFTIYGGLTART
jgi:hypothetical protein